VQYPYSRPLICLLQGSRALRPSIDPPRIHGFEPRREAAIVAFAKSWRRE
jgi:hypothetical protein